MRSLVMKAMLMVLTMLVIGGCTKSSTPAPILAIVQAAQGTICPMAQAFADDAGSKLAGMTGATNLLSCGAALYQPVMNAGICSQPVPTSIASLVGASYKTIGDIPAEAIKGKALAHALAAHPNGVISSIVCPLGVGVAMGVVSASIPAACQGPNSLSASTIDAQFVAVCQTLTAALP